MKIFGARSGVLLSVLTLCSLGIIRVAKGSVLQSLLYIPDEEPECYQDCRNLNRNYWPRCCESHNTCCREFVNDCIKDCRPRVAHQGDLTMAEERPGMCCYMYNLCCTREVFRITPIVRGTPESIKLPIVHRFGGGAADFHANSSKRASYEEEQELKAKQQIEDAKRKLLNRRGDSQTSVRNVVPKAPLAEPQPPVRNVAPKVSLAEGERRVANLRAGGINIRKANLPRKQKEKEQDASGATVIPRRVVVRSRQKSRERKENNRNNASPRQENTSSRQGVMNIRQKISPENVRIEQENAGERRTISNTIPNIEYTAQQDNIRQENTEPVQNEDTLLSEAVYTEQDVPFRENKPAAREYVEIRRGGPAPEQGETQSKNVELAQESIGARAETIVATGQESAITNQAEGQVR